MPAMWGSISLFITSPSGALALLVLQVMILAVAIWIRRMFSAGQLWWVIPPAGGWLFAWILAGLPVLLARKIPFRAVTFLLTTQSVFATVSLIGTVVGIIAWGRTVVLQWSNILEILESGSQGKEGGKLKTVFEELPDPRRVWPLYAGGAIALVLVLVLLGALIGGKAGATNLAIIGVIVAVVPGLWYTVLYNWYERQRGIVSLYSDIQNKITPIVQSSTKLRTLVKECEDAVVLKFAAMTVEMNETFKSAKEFAAIYGKRVDDIERLGSTRDESQLLAVNELLKENIEVRANFMDSVMQSNKNMTLVPDQWIPKVEEKCQDLKNILDHLARH